jgi:hypothetical protein
MQWPQQNDNIGPDKTILSKATLPVDSFVPASGDLDRKPGNGKGAEQAACAQCHDSGHLRRPMGIEVMSIAKEEDLLKLHL